MLWLLWATIGLMLIIAVGLIIWPLLKPRQNREYLSRDILNIKLYKENHAALQAQLAGKQITQHDFITLENELKKELLKSVDITRNTTVYNKPAYVTAIILLVTFPIAAILIYNQIGTQTALKHYLVLKKQRQEVKAYLAKLKSPQQVVDQLKAYLAAYPNSPKGWYLLGRLYLGQENYAQAKGALNKAHRLQPNNVEYSIAYAQAVFFANNRNLTPKAVALLKAIINKDEYNIAAINLLAINAYGNQHYQSAVNYWERLIPVFAPGSRDSQVLLHMISKAQKHLSSHKQVLSATDVIIKTSVKLSAKLLAKVTPTEDVFVYAQSVDGPPMPLAVVRIKASALPITVNLTSKEAMVPGHTLMTGQVIKITARVSKTGSPMPQSGDLASAVKVLTVQNQNHPVTLTINHIVN